jgi:hypothetical protein
MPTNPEVDDWFENYDHPAKDAMQRVREIILEDNRIAETIKWQSPTFMFEGNMASFNPRTKSQVSLMLHTGASIPGSFGRMDGGGETSRYMKFADLGEVDDAAEELRSIVAAWCNSR